MLKFNRELNTTESSNIDENLNLSKYKAFKFEDIKSRVSIW